MLVTVVVGNPKALFSIATTPRCSEGCNSFPWITLLHFTLDGYVKTLSVRQADTKYYFLSRWYDST